MVELLLGTGLPSQGRRLEVEARTLGEALERLGTQVEGIDRARVRCFVGGVDSDWLEGASTPVGDEDTVLLARKPGEQPSGPTQGDPS